MNEGQQIQDIAKTLLRQTQASKDYIAKTSVLNMVQSHEGNIVHIVGLEKGSQYPITAYAHGQIADYAGIPRKYYDKMRSHSAELLAKNVNYWLSTNDDRRMIRTLDGEIRAVLSDKYKVLDNFDLASAVLPVIQERGCKIASAALTESKLYIKTVLPEMAMEIKSSRTKGDVVQAGIVISNSEVGDGAVKIEPFIFRLVCLNGMIANVAAMKRQHLGRGYDISDSAYELLTSETKSADDTAFWLKVRDVVAGAFDKGVFAEVVQSMEEATQLQIKSKDIPDVIEVIGKRYGVSESHQKNVLTHLIEGGDLSKWGMVNALTRTADDFTDYETSTSFERVGGQLLSSTTSEWNAMTQ